MTATAPTLAIGFGDSVKAGFQNYVNFWGRASRADYWYFHLFYFIIEIICNVVDLITGVKALQYVAVLIFWLPLFALEMRRLHDTGRSIWWILIAFTGIGAIFLLVWLCQKGDFTENKYGPGPAIAT